MVSSFPLLSVLLTLRVRGVSKDGQLAELASLLPPEGAVIVCGDFNQRAPRRLDLGGCVACCGEATHTDGGCYDHVFVRGGRCLAASVQKWKTKEGNHLSDHFFLLCDLDI